MQNNSAADIHLFAYAGNLVQDVLPKRVSGAKMIRQLLFNRKQPVIENTKILWSKAECRSVLCVILCIF